MRSLIAFFTKQGVFADLLTVFVIVIGIGSAFIIRREVFPNVQFDIITVTTIYPGSTPSEIEKLVTNPLEQELKEVDGIKKMTSISTEGRSMISLFVDTDETTAEEAKVDIQDVIDRVTDLPSEAEDPIVESLESKNNPVIEVNVAANIPRMELRKIARFVEDELEDLKGVARVDAPSVRDLEVKVEADLRKLARYRLSLDDVVNAIRGQNQSVPGGPIEVTTLQKKKGESVVRTTGEFDSPGDVGDTVIRANELGQAIRVKDVAKVTFGLEEAKVLYRTNGVNSIALTVVKKAKADAIDLVHEIKEKVTALQPQVGEGVEFSYVNDVSYYIKRRLKILSNNLGVGLALVLIVLSMILPFRVAMLVSIGIPFGFLGTITLFNMWGFSLNLISVMGLIIVIGMLVDDAVVVTENAVRQMEDGASPEEAAIEGTYQVWGPVTASVMTTIFAFTPLMMMSGIFGKFVKVLPVGVIVSLLISLIECFFVLPHHISKWIDMKKLKERDRQKKPGPLKRFSQKTTALWEEGVVPFYSKTLSRFLDKKYWVVAGFTVLFVGTLGMSTQLKFVLFPPDGVEIFQVNMDAPVGITLEEMSEAIRPVEEEILKLSPVELDSFTTKVGLRQLEKNDPNTTRGPEYAQIIVYLTPEPDRDRTAKEIIDSLKAATPKPDALEKLTFARINPGPPVGKPISVGVRGKDFSSILPAVEAIKKVAQEIKGTSDIDDTFVEGKDEIQIRVKAADAAAAGLNVLAIGRGVRAAFEGLIASSIRKLDEEIEIRVSLPEDSQKTTESLDKLLISNPQGNLIPLSEVAEIIHTKGSTTYIHEANKREVRVIGEVNTEVISAREVATRIQEKLPEIQKNHPNVTFHFGGENEDTEESFQSLVRAAVIAISGIFLILVLNFKQILQPILILTITIPLGVIGVMWTFFLHGKPLSFMAMMGTIALAGVVVNNAIVLVDFVNQERKKGKNQRDSIVSAALMRIRPIFLTTLTTVFGILPTAYGIGGLDKFVVPIALALGWGMLIGSIITSLVLPPFISVLDDFSALMGRIFGKKKTETL